MVMAASLHARQNQLLAALPDAVLERWLPRLEWADLPLGRVLHRPGDRLSHLWFPTTAVVCLLNSTKEGASAEVAIIGSEGVVGAPLFMGGDSTPSWAVVQIGGEGLRMTAQTIKDEFERGGPARQLMLRYAQALATQIAQTAVCNRHHGLDRQLCRWLLTSLDRTQGSELAVTQERIAHLLGFRREGVSEIAGRLRKRGLIGYGRGHVRVLDRAGLEAQACECYRVVKREYERLLG